MTPITLNESWRVTADDLQYIVQRRSNRGTWEGVIFCQTKAGLMAHLGYEVRISALTRSPGWNRSQSTVPRFETMRPPRDARNPSVRIPSRQCDDSKAEPE
jgi:hypothetical protein